LSIAQKCKSIQYKSHEIADEYYALHREVLKMSNLMKCTDVPQLVMLEQKLAELLRRQGDYHISQGENIQT